MAEMAILVDMTRCDACRGCQVACKQWNGLPGTGCTRIPRPGYQNPPDLSFDTLCLLKFFVDSSNPGKDVDADGNWNFLKYQCMHCDNPKCLTVCRSAGDCFSIDSTTGFVYLDELCCKNYQAASGPCKLCELGCQFGAIRVGTLGSDTFARKCTACLGSWSTQGDRLAGNYPAGIKDAAPSDWLHISGQPGNDDLLPACVTTCPTDALDYDTRANIIGKANARAADANVLAKYPDVNVYGTIAPKLHVITVLTRLRNWYAPSLPTF